MADRADETPEQRTARFLRKQGEACGLMGSPLYDVLLRNASDDLLAGGPTRQVLDAHLEDPGPSALALRMMGGVHALVLDGRVPELAGFYPSARPENRVRDAQECWPVFATVLERHRDEIREWLQRPPQTNEVGRAAALIGGLRHVCAEAQLPVRLVEVGASGGLNLRADHFRVDGEAGQYGDPASPVQLGTAWLGVPPPDGRIEIVERRGGDLDPIDVSTQSGCLLLTSYVWPDQVTRLERLRGAFEVAAVVPVTVDRESAEQTLARTELVDDTWTVLWHSVFQQYLPKDIRLQFNEHIQRLGETATGTARFAHLSLEPERRASYSTEFEFLIKLQTWPGGEQRILGTAPGHGIPTTWER